jgi:hypothetical protein
MKQFYILGQRVNTYKFGLGTVVGFEVLNLGNNSPVEVHEHNTHYEPEDNPCEYSGTDYECSERGLNCCDCGSGGGAGCGCSYCWSCNACDNCKG